MFAARRYRLYLSAEQQARAQSIAGACRATWNAALEQRRTAYRLSGRSPGYAEQCRDLTEARAQIEWLREAPAQALQQTLRDLGRAFERSFRGEAGYPRFKRRGCRDAFRLPQGRHLHIRRLNRRWAEVRLPKLGWCRFRFTCPLGGEIRHATVRRDALGWHVSFCVAAEREPAPANGGPPVGVDRGVAISVADSDGGLHEVPALPPGATERLRRLRRKAGRQETARRRRAPSGRRRSRRHQRTLEAVARLRAREARLRQDFLHNLSTDLAKSHGLIALEALRVKQMTRSARGTATEPGVGVAHKRGLNRAILAQGWGELRRQLAYKADWYGSRLVEIPAAYSSQECAECGAADAASRKAQRFACTTCGHRAHADTNAALVVLARAMSAQEDGGRAGRRSAGSLRRRPGLRTANHPEALAV